ncbi:MAG: WG repeat-containing protein, partial [Elusimicrobiota bacterium]
MRKIFLIYVMILPALPGIAGSQELIPYNSGGKWGYAAPGGKLLIPARYDYAEPFSEGLAL